MWYQANRPIFGLTIPIVKNGQRLLIILPCELIHLWDAQVLGTLKEMEIDKNIEQNHHRYHHHQQQKVQSNQV